MLKRTRNIATSIHENLIRQAVRTAGDYREILIEDEGVSVIGARLTWRDRIIDAAGNW